MLRSQLKFAIRNIWKFKLFGLLNIIGLSIGMTSFILIALWVQNEFNFDSFYTNQANIFRITYANRQGTRKWDGSPYPFADAAKSEIPEIKRVARLEIAKFNSPVLQMNNEYIREKNLVFVDSSWFSLFNTESSQHGTLLSDHANDLVITQAIAKKYFGNKEAAGQVISIDSSQFRVSKAIENNPPNSSFQFDVLLPMQAYISKPANKEAASSWDRYEFITFVEIQPGAVKEATEKLNALFRSRTKGEAPIVSLVPLSAIHFETGLAGSNLPHGDKKTIQLFFLIGVLLLGIACINFINLSTATVALRAREIGIKKIIGAERKTLIFQLIAESVITCLAALVLTLALLFITLPLLDKLTANHFEFLASALKIGVLLLSTLVVSIVLTSIYPSVVISSLNPLKGVRGLNIFKLKSTTIRRSLVTLQFVISIVLIAGNLIIYKQLRFINSQQDIFSHADIFSFSIPSGWLMRHPTANKSQLLDFLKQRLSNDLSIDKIATGSSSVINDKLNMQGVVSWEDKKPDFAPMITPFSGDKDFLNIFPLSLGEGRWFLNGEADKHNYILNETAVNELGLHLPAIGQRFSFLQDTGKIIGIVKDFHYLNYHEKIGSMVILNSSKMGGTIFIKAAKSRSGAALEAVRKLYSSVFTGEPFQYSFVDDEFNELYRPDIRNAQLTKTFSYIAILVSCLGLFGLSALATQQRTKEIGVRKILGATEYSLIALLSREFIRLVGLAFLIAIPLSWWTMNKWLETFAYRTPLNWWIFGLAGLIALLVAMIPVGFHAYRIAVSNPIIATRTE